MTKYKIHPRQAHREVLVTVVDGKAVNLVGKPANKAHPATPDAAAWEETIPPATQAHLKKVFESGTRDRDGYPLVVVVVEDSAASEAKEKTGK